MRAVSWVLFGDQAGYYHVASVLLHLLNLGLIYWLIFRFSGKRWLAGLVTLVVGIHPILTEAVSYISSQATLLAALSFLVICLLILYEKWPPLAWFIFALSVMLKETALPGLAVFFLLFWMQSPKKTEKSKISDATLRIAPYLAITAVFLVLWRILVPNIQNFRWASPWVIPYTIWRYLSVIFWPVKLIILDSQYSRFFPHNIFDPGVIPGIVATLLILGMIYLAWRKKWNEELLGFICFLAFIAPFLQIVAPTGTIIGTRNLYVPLIGLSMGIFSLIHRVIDRFKLWGSRKLIFVGGISGAVAVMALTGAAYARSQDWENGGTFWGSALRVDPQNLAGLTNLSGYYLMDGLDPQKALEIAQQHLKMYPGHFAGWLNLADAYAELGQAERAEKEYLALLKAYPWNGKVQRRLNYFYGALGINSGINVKIVGNGSAYFEIHSAKDPNLAIDWQELENRESKIYLVPGDYYIIFHEAKSEPFTIKENAWFPVTIKL